VDSIAVQILTYNEETNLPRCLAALSWCDNIVVIDSGSTDKTVEIAENGGCTVLHRPFDDFANQRNFGIDSGALTEDWVLHLDADEVVTEELANEIAKLQPPNNIQAYNIPSKLMLGKQWLKHCGAYPVYQVRLGRTKGLRFIQYGHAQREDLSADAVGTLKQPYLHYNFSHGLQRWFEKHVRYASDEANQILTGPNDNSPDSQEVTGTAMRRRLKSRAAKIPAVLRPIARFFYIYFLKQGFRDGRAGLQYAVMLSTYEAMTAVFLMQTAKRKSN